MGFLELRILDLIDILLVAYLLYKIYMLIRGTVAINIFVVVFVTYLFWLIVKAFNMELLSTILGQVMGVGVIALLIVFQQEIRRFLLIIGNKYFVNTNLSLEYFFSSIIKDDSVLVNVEQIVQACDNMSRSKTGALIIIPQKSELITIAETGVLLHSVTTSKLLETIFFKNGPLHDGAVIIQDDKILAARCVLPLSDNPHIPSHLGLRHRSAIGVTESTDSVAIIVSEERGQISYALNGIIHVNVTAQKLLSALNEIFINDHIKKKFELKAPFEKFKSLIDK